MTEERLFMQLSFRARREKQFGTYIFRSERIKESDKNIFGTFKAYGIIRGQTVFGIRFYGNLGMSCNIIFP